MLSMLSLTIPQNKTASAGVLSREPAGTYPSHQRGSRCSCPFCQRRCAATASPSGRTKGSYPTGQVRRKEKGCPYISHGHLKLDGALPSPNTRWFHLTFIYWIYYARLTYLNFPITPGCYPYIWKDCEQVMKQTKHE